jgi:hypothetical protein
MTGKQETDPLPKFLSWLRKPLHRAYHSLVRDTVKRFSSSALTAVCHPPNRHSLRRFVSLAADYMIVFLTAISILDKTSAPYLFERRA